jgi:hypothetical protein
VLLEVSDQLDCEMLQVFDHHLRLEQAKRNIFLGLNKQKIRDLLDLDYHQQLGKW